MNIHPRLIGFDIDGVVADTMDAFIRLARNDYGTEVFPEQITEFQVEDCLDMDPVVVEEIFARLLSRPLESGLKLMPHARRVLTEFSEMGPLSFVTARPEREPIARWLAEELGQEVYARVRLEATGVHDGKGAFISAMGLQYFVDDRAQTCEQLTLQGIRSIVYDQPWNYGKHDLPSVDGWLAIRGLCLGSVPK
jgi:uncharacterized HAD superfamily protein